jgi:16S rRNA (cytosine967-C5)-methyltransferase
MAARRCLADVARPPARTPGRTTGRRSGAGASRGRPPADPARRVALDLLLAVDDRDAYANLLLPGLMTRRGLSGRDAALATELSYGTLRGQGTYDAVLAICSDRPVASLDPVVRAVLRLGTHQLLGTRIQQHAAVATSVNLIKEAAGQRPAGFVNAVLRRVASRDLDGWLGIAAPAPEADPAGHLAVRFSHPRWMVEAFAAALGETPAGAPGSAGGRGGADSESMPQTRALLAANSQRPAVHLCVVPGLAAQRELAEAGCEPAAWSPYGAYLADGDPRAIGAVAEGRAGAQDEASQLAAIALTRVSLDGPDERWLDLCAGPGGKARLLAGLAAGADARIVAAEVREHRAALVRAALRRVPAGSAGVVAADGRQPAWRPAAFDRVLADVPCTGLGALRRRPEARWRRTPADVSTLGELQRALLRAAVDSVRPGGAVAYVTCSPHLAETRDVLADVLPARPDVEVLDAPAVLSEVPDLAVSYRPVSSGPGTGGRYAQFWPHLHGTDAIFVALLRRTS